MDIAGVIIHLRTQRMKMVQSPVRTLASSGVVVKYFFYYMPFCWFTQEQYIFIHDAIFEVVSCGDTQIDAGNFYRYFHKINKHYPGTHLDEFENQYKVCSYTIGDSNDTYILSILQVLERISPKPVEVEQSIGLKYSTKNRSEHYLPSEFIPFIQKLIKKTNLV